MAVNWPSSFPAATIQGYALKPGDRIARTEMESGAARQRQRFSSVPTQIPVRWLMSQGVFELFESWYLHKAKAGAQWVTMSLYSGIGYAAQDTRFLKPYKAKLLSTTQLWEVTAMLEVRDMAVMSEYDLDNALNQ